jgi:hypothetical protein
MAIKASFRKQFAKLKRRLNQIEGRLKEISIVTATSKETTNSFWNKIQRDMMVEYEKARIVFSEYSNLEIPRSYMTSLQAQIRRIKGMKFKPLNPLSFSKFSDKNIHKQSIAIVLEDSISSYFSGLELGEKKFIQLIRATQQLNLTEKEINKAVETGFIEGSPGVVDLDKKVGAGSLYGVQRNVRNELLKDALNEQYITIVDKNGKPINYNLKTYAELVARTKLIEAQTSATVNLSLGYGSGLIQVSSHNTLTAYDAQFEGKVYDLTGKNPRFPNATDLPPFHPNCQHTTTVFFEEALSDKQVTKISDFSKGKTEIHPTRKSHIPISQRAA